jgi:antibiotic biosynthesis monooxygenase (ABM) superfamily enzyme
LKTNKKKPSPKKPPKIKTLLTTINLMFIVLIMQPFMAG